MFSRTFALVSLALSLAMVGCSSDPSTMRRVNANGPMPSVSDPRTGVVAAIDLQSDGSYVTSLRRIENGAYVTLTPPIPDDHMGQIHSVFWHDGSALAGDLSGHIFRFTPELGWETLDASQCDPTLSLVLLTDAPAQDDAWVLAAGDSGATLCHFDGHDFTSAESLDFNPQDVVDFDGVLYASESNRVMHRAVDQNEWTPVVGVDTTTSSIDALVVRNDAVYARIFGTDADTYWRVTGRTGAIDGVPGLNGEHWRTDEHDQTHTSCSRSWITGDTNCSEIVDVMEMHVVRIEGGVESERGFLRLENPGSLWLESVVTGEDQMILTSSSGDVWVTPES